MKHSKDILDLNNRLFLYKFDNRKQLKFGPSRYIAGLVDRIKYILKKLLKQFGCLKFQLAPQVTLIKHTYDELDREHESKICYPWFISNMKIVHTKFELMDKLSSMVDEVIAKFDSWYTKKRTPFTSKLFALKRRYTVELYLLIVSRHY